MSRRPRRLGPRAPGGFSSRTFLAGPILPARCLPSRSFVQNRRAHHKVAPTPPALRCERGRPSASASLQWTAVSPATRCSVPASGSGPRCGSNPVSRRSSFYIQDSKSRGCPPRFVHQHCLPCRPIRRRGVYDHLTGSDISRTKRPRIPPRSFGLGLPLPWVAWLWQNSRIASRVLTQRILHSTGSGTGDLGVLGSAASMPCGFRGRCKSRNNRRFLPCARLSFFGLAGRGS